MRERYPAAGTRHDSCCPSCSGHSATDYGRLCSRWLEHQPRHRASATRKPTTSGKATSPPQLLASTTPTGITSVAYRSPAPSALSLTPRTLRGVRMHCFTSSHKRPSNSVAEVPCTVRAYASCALPRLSIMLPLRHRAHHRCVPSQGTSRVYVPSRRSRWRLRPRSKLAVLDRPARCSGSSTISH